MMRLGEGPSRSLRLIQALSAVASWSNPDRQWSRPPGSRHRAGARSLKLGAYRVEVDSNREQVGTQLLSPGRSVRVHGAEAFPWVFVGHQRGAAR
jgi:hypothetical protein